MNDFRLLINLSNPLVRRVLGFYYFIIVFSISLLIGGDSYRTILANSPTLISFGLWGTLLGAAIFNEDKITNGIQAIWRGLISVWLAIPTSFCLSAIYQMLTMLLSGKGVHLFPFFLNSLTYGFVLSLTAIITTGWLIGLLSILASWLAYRFTQRLNDAT